MSRKWKLCFQFILVLCHLVVLILGTGLWWLQSNSFDSWLFSKILLELNSYGIEAEINHFDANPLQLSAEVSGVKLKFIQEPTPFFTVDKLTIKSRLINFFKPEFIVEFITIEHPSLKIEFDEKGTINLARIHIPEKLSQKQSTEMWSGKILLKDGNILVSDHSYKLDGEVRNLHLGLSTVDNVQKWEIGASDSQVLFQGKQINDISYQAEIFLKPTNAQVQLLSIKSQYGETNFKGDISWKDDNSKFKYEGDIFASLNLAKINEQFMPNMSLGGLVKLHAKLKGDNQTYQIKGNLEPWYTKAFGANLSVITSNYDFSSPLIPFFPLLKSQVNIGRVTYNNVALEDFIAQVEVTPEAINIQNFQSKIGTGKLNGIANINFGNTLISKAELKFKDVNLDKLSVLAKYVPIEVSTAGIANFSWPGIEFNKSVGNVVAKFNGHVLNKNNQKDPSLLINGELFTSVNFSGAKIEKFNADVGTSNLQLVGSYNWFNQMQLVAHLSAPNLNEVKLIASKYGFFEDRNLNVVVPMGSCTFDGKIAGSVVLPEITGQVSFNNLNLGKITAEKITIDFIASRQLLNIKQAEFLQFGGGIVTASVNLDKTSSVDLKFRNFNATPFSSLLTNNLTSFINEAGLVSGQIHLKNLPEFAVLHSIYSSKEKIYDAKLLFKIISTVQGNGDIVISSLKTSYGLLNRSSVRFRIAEDNYYLDQLNLIGGFGKYLATGKYNRSNQEYELDIHCKNLDLAALNLSSQLNLPNVSGSVSLDLFSHSKLDLLLNEEPQFTITGTSNDIEVGKIKLGKLELSSQADKGLVGFKIKTQLFEHFYDTTGQIDLKNKDYLLQASMHFHQASVSPILAISGLSSQKVTGAITGNINVTGPLLINNKIQNSHSRKVFSVAALKLNSEFSNIYLTINSGDTSENNYSIANDGPVKIEAASGEVMFTQCNLKGSNTRLNVTGRISTVGRTSLGFDGDVDLRLLRTFFANSAYASGIAHLKANLSGTKDNPRLTGAAEVDDLNLRIVGIPVSLEHGGGRILFTSNKAQIESFTADSGGGKIELSGGFVLDDLDVMRWQLGLRADNVRLAYPGDIHSLVDGTLTFQGNRNVQLLSGNVKVKHAEYREKTDIASLIQSGFGTISTKKIGLQANSLSRSSLSLDIKVDAPDSIFIHNDVADIVGTAALQIRGSLSNPKIIGRIMVVRGQLEFRNDRYQIKHGSFVFPDSNVEKPAFDFQAETELQGYRVIMSFTGTVEKPALALRSEPALPQLSILTLLATGTLPSSGQIQNDLSAATQQNSSSAAATNLLTGLLSERVEERTNRLLGINRFQIDPLLVGRGTDSTARLTIGRRITKDLSVTYSTNLASTEQYIILIEYKLLKNISIVGIRDQKGFGFDVRSIKRF